MIDWITAIFPCYHASAINDGEFISLDQDGSIEWATKKRLNVRGSYESNILIRSVEKTRNHDGSYQEICIDGNFAKWHQGHNLWGSDDLTGLAAETYFSVCSLLGLQPTDFDLLRVINGAYQLTRVDCTRMIELGSLGNVEAFLYSAEQTAHLRHRGQGIMTKGTLYFGKTSRRWALKMYAKGPEINRKGHKIPLDIDTPSLQTWATSKLRIELVLRSMGLKDKGLHIAANWGDNTTSECLDNCLEGLQMAEKHRLPPEVIKELAPRLQLVYTSWMDGHDIRAILPKMTFYRYRNQLKEHGIDIAVKQGNRNEPAANVVEFRRVLRPERCEQVPEWAIGTNLYFEPRKRFSS